MATKRIKTAEVMTSLRASAAEVLVGDLVSPGPDATFRRVVTVTRTERGVALTYRMKDGGGEVTRDYSENAAVDIATRIQRPAGVLLYRVAPHPTRPGVAAFVSIPEE